MISIAGILLIIAAVLFAVEAARSRSLVAAGLFCMALALLFTNHWLVH